MFLRVWAVSLLVPTHSSWRWRAVMLVVIWKRSVEMCWKAAKSPSAGPAGGRPAAGPGGVGMCVCACVRMSMSEG